MMRAGRLRHRIDIERRELSAANAYGERTQEWQTYVTSIPADIRSLVGRELIAARQVVEHVSHIVSIRYGSNVEGLDSTCRVKFGSRTFSISHVANVEERNVEVLLYCEESR